MKEKMRKRLSKWGREKEADDNVSRGIEKIGSKVNSGYSEKGRRGYAQFQQGEEDVDLRAFSEKAQGIAHLLITV